MKNHNFLKPLFFVLLFLTQTSTWADPVVTKIGKHDLPPGVKIILHAEQVLLSRELNETRIISPKITNQDELFRPENRNVFEVKTYWIPEEHLQAFENSSADPKLKKLMQRTRNNKKEWRLIVHPETENFYKDLIKKGKPGGNFLATSTSSSRTLAIWPPGKPEMVFFGKLSLDKNIGGVVRTIPGTEVARSIGTGKLLDSIKPKLPESFEYFSESMGIMPKGQLRGGMIIREIPDAIKSGKEKFVPLFSLYGKCPNCKSPPLLVSMINKSKMRPDDFVREKIITPFVDQWVELAVKQGISTEPHAQNVLIGIGSDGLPNGKFLHRDFGGFNIDFNYRESKSLPIPKNMPVINDIKEDYHQKYSKNSLKQSIHTYFSEGFIYNIDQNLSQWSKEGLIPSYPKNNSKSVFKNMLYDELAKKVEVTNRKEIIEADDFEKRLTTIKRRKDPYASLRCQNALKAFLLKHSN